MLQFLQSVLTLVEKLAEWLVAALVAMLGAILALQLVDRYWITLPIAAPDQYARVALIWLTFLGFAMALRSGTTVRVDLIDSRLPLRMRRALEFIFDAILLVLLAVLVIKGWSIVSLGAGQERLGTIMSEAVPSFALFQGAVLMWIFVALRFILRILGRAPEQTTGHF